MNAFNFYFRIREKLGLLHKESNSTRIECTKWKPLRCELKALPIHVQYRCVKPWKITAPLLKLKTVDTIGNCQRPVFSLGVYQHKITNLWKFEPNRSSKLRDNNDRKKHPCHTKLCAFICLISRPQILNLRSRNQIREKLLLSQKLHYFRGSRFSQCFILSTSPHYLLPSEVLCW